MSVSLVFSGSDAYASHYAAVEVVHASLLRTAADACGVQKRFFIVDYAIFASTSVFCLHFFEIIVC